LNEIELDYDTEINFTHFKTLDAKSNNGYFKRQLSELYTALSKPTISSNKYSKGLIVSGCVDGNRDRNHTRHKNIILLDIDDLPAHYDLFREFSGRWKYGFAVYTSYNHVDTAPRYRLVIPINRNLKNNEYVALVKYIEKHLDLPKLDPKSYEVSQSFALPVIKSDSHEYIFEYADEEILNVTDALIERAIQEQPVIQSVYKAAIQSTEWQSILSPKEDGEGRNEALVTVLGSLLRRYVDVELAYYLLRLWNDHHHTPMTNDEFDKSFKSILNKEMQRRENADWRWKDDERKSARYTDSRWVK